MYVPESFRIEDEVEIEAFLQVHDFATIVSSSPAGLQATHVPVVIRRDGSGLIIAGHVARANSHWEAMDGQAESLAIFHGPHHYVSPSWYVDSPAVPTWNYAVVHAHGMPRARQDREFIETVLVDLAERYEGRRSSPWRMENMPPDYRDGLMAAIVGFEMQVVRLEAKFKIGQNRRSADQAGTITGLEREGSPEAARMAAFMRSHLNGG